MFIKIIMEDEEWRLLEYEDILTNTYKISNYGRVYSSLKNRLIKPADHNQGYMHITLKTKSGEYRKILIHRLVANSFITNYDNKPFVNHINGNKKDNYYKNLEWVTSSENNMHALHNKLNNCSEIFKIKYKGSGNPNYKYSDEMIHYICKYIENGYSTKNITKIFIDKYPSFKYKSVYKYINTKIKNRLYRTDISNQYNF